MAEALSLQIDNIDAKPRVPLTYFNVPPWARGTGTVQVCPTLPGITSKNADPEEIRQAARRRYADINAEINIYTDAQCAKTGKKLIFNFFNSSQEVNKFRN